MDLLIIQYGGDYREAFKRLAKGGSETYYAQKNSIDAVAEIGKQIGEVATLCCMTENPIISCWKKEFVPLVQGLMERLTLKS